MLCYSQLCPVVPISPVHPTPNLPSVPWTPATSSVPKSSMSCHLESAWHSREMGGGVAAPVSGKPRVVWQSGVRSPKARWNGSVTSCQSRDAVNTGGVSSYTAYMALCQENYTHNNSKSLVVGTVSRTQPLPGTISHGPWDITGCWAFI